MCQIPRQRNWAKIREAHRRRLKCARAFVFSHLQPPGVAWRTAPGAFSFPPAPAQSHNFSSVATTFFWGPLRHRRAAGRHLGGGSRPPRRAVWGPKTQMGGTHLSFWHPDGAPGRLEPTPKVPPLRPKSATSEIHPKFTTVNLGGNSKGPQEVI